MITEPIDVKHILSTFETPIDPIYSSYVKIDWISRNFVSFRHVEHLKNPFNKNQTVNYSKELQ